MPKRKIFPKGMPDYSDLINPTITAMQKLGGSGNIDEIYNEVLLLLNIPENIIVIQHSDKSNQSEIQYRLDWARTYLKIYGIITNSSRGVWVIKPQFKDIEEVDISDCLSKVKSLYKDKANESQQSTNNPNNDNVVNEVFDLPEEIKPWKIKLWEILTNMNPYSFERLTQHLLRENGFTEVKVTKKSGDGGIDGFGRLKINGIFSFKVAFQCKRYTNTPVPVGDIRDFRGSLTTDVEKAIFITTSSFSKAAMEDAFAQGKFQIDLIDGDVFIDKLAEFGIGVSEVKDYIIDEDYFSQIQNSVVFLLFHILRLANKKPH